MLYLHDYLYVMFCENAGRKLRASECLTLVPRIGGKHCYSRWVICQMESV